MRWVVVLLAGCWTSSAKPEPYWIPPKEPEPTPVACSAFDANDPACATTCHRDAPDDWGGCEKLATELQTQGYVCRKLHPRTCQMAPVQACPQSGCVAFDARIIKIAVVGNHVEVTISAGGTRGVTTAWKAHLLDRPGGVPLGGGQLTLTVVHPNYSVATTSVTRDQVTSTPYVRLTP